MRTAAATSERRRAMNDTRELNIGTYFATATRPKGRVMLTTFARSVVTTAAACALIIAVPNRANALTIPLNITLDDLIAVNATLTVDVAVVQTGSLVISASAAGSATLNGISATIDAQ